MDEKSKSLLVDQIFHDIESLMVADDEPTKTTKALTIWILEEYKTKFEELQDRTDKKFGKKLKELIYLAIDKAIES